MLFIYLIKNFLLDILLFFKHWYWDGFHFFYGKALGVIRKLEKTLAIKLNLAFIFRPLYQEYNVYGYFLGFVFRTFRIITGGLFYMLIVALFSAVYLLWAAFPVFIVYKIIK